MKKQINPTTKAYLIRGAFYLLLLIAVCAIPFALAQRNATRPSRAGADTILEHFQPQTAQPAPRFVPMPPSGGIDCDNQPGIIIHDDGGLENGYSGVAGFHTEVRFADKFTPSSYPVSYTSVCLDFVIVSGGPA